jgi:hypothetical protein
MVPAPLKIETGYLPRAKLDDKDVWVKLRQRAGLRYMRDGKPIPGELFRQLARKNWCEMDGKTQQLTTFGRRVLEVIGG